MYKAVKGMNDIYGAEAVRWGKMEEALRLIVSRFNYTEIKTPILEDYSLFARGLGNTSDVVQKEMYVMEDRNGEKLAMRPEMTAGVVRAFIEHNMANESPAPHKFFYIGQNYRYERPQKGRYRQFHQLGLEIFGDPTAEMDAELIFAANKIMEHFKVKAQFRINSIGCKECRPVYRQKLIDYLKPKIHDMCEDCKNRLEINPLRVLDCKVDKIKEKCADIPLITENLCGTCATDFERLKKALEIFHVPFTVDPYIVRGLDYYTKTAFEITADTGGSQNAIAGGGRYDNLVEEMGGKAVPATGFAIGLERLLSVIPADFFAQESLCMGFSLFDGGIESLVHFAKHISHHPVKFMAEYTPRKMKNALQKADKLGVRHVFIFGESEVAESKLLYKDMKTGEQQVFGQHEIMAIVDMLMNKEVVELSSSSLK